MRTISIISMMALFATGSCGDPIPNMGYSLDTAGENRQELEAVLSYYGTQDRNVDKMKAAVFLISNMPFHYSYRSDSIHLYYDEAAAILSNASLSPESQRDSLLYLSQTVYKNLPYDIGPDNRVVTKEFLIHTIDQSYKQWKESPWASQLTLSDYMEWLLPYKATECQELDYWRDTLLCHFGDGLRHPIRNDVEYNTTAGVSDMIRNEVLEKVNRYGLYTPSGLPLLSSYLLPRQTFGNISDYALLATLSFRSMGIPAVLDETPVGSRYTAATKWFVILSDRGEEQPSEWDLSTPTGWSFFPHERGPKVFRNTFGVDRRRLKYMMNAKYKYPFDLTVKDVTHKYFLTSEICIPVKTRYRSKLQDNYVYIASAIRTGQDSKTHEGCPDPDGWKIVDFGILNRGKVWFHNMGREVIYRVYGFDGNGLIPISEPFLLKKNGMIKYYSTDTIYSPLFDKWFNNPV